ncbi:MAG: tetratricopeptide repeat protein [Persicimonas sp.]
MEDTAERVAGSIEDNYPEYVEQVYGYAYEVDDVMSQQALARHDELLRATPDQLEQVDVGSLDDFQLWAVARAWRRQGDFDRFVEFSERLLSSDNQHPVVIYSEISRGLARELAGVGRLQDARERLETHLQEWEGDVQARQLAGVIDVLEDDEQDNDEQLRRLAREFPSDAELRFEIAEDLWRFGSHQPAEKWLDEAREVARETGDHATLVDIELLADKLG